MIINHQWGSLMGSLKKKVDLIGEGETFEKAAREEKA